MILSSADILRILGGSEIVRLTSKLSIVDSKPALSGAEGIRVYINRFPSLTEFESTWQIWIEADEEDDLVVAELKRLLPKVQVTRGLMTTITTTEFRSESTQAAPEAPKVQTAQVDLKQYEERLQALVEDVQDQMLLVNSGRPGRDGQDGRDGADGRDGKDLVATDAELFDLQDVEQGIQMEKGQVLTWNGAQWTNLFVPQVYSSGSAAATTTGSGDAVSATVQWRFNSTPHEVEPDPGDFHTDSTDGELVTVIRVSNTTNRGNDISVLMGDLLQQGYDRLYVALSEDLSRAHLYNINSYLPTASGVELSVIHVQTAGLELDYVQPKTYEFYISKSATGGGGGVPEAPVDGKQYARENATWTEVAPTGLQPGDNISELVNDAGYVTSADIPTVPVTSVAGKTGDVTLAKADITDFSDADYATAAQGALADSAIQTGDNISELVNDANYIPEAPTDGNYYVRSNSQWVKLTDALAALGVPYAEPVDGGDFTDGDGTAITNRLYDGGDFTGGTSAATDSVVLDGGVTTP